MDIIDSIYQIQLLLVEIFNTRELANLAWILIAISVTIFIPQLRKSIFDLLKHLFAWKFVIIYAIAFIYIQFIVLKLEKLGLWNLAFLKDTIYWAVLTCLTLMYKIGRSKKPLSSLKALLKTSIQFSVVIQFIANLETFNFWFEFIAIPIIILFSGIYVLSESQIEHAVVRKLIKKLGTILSIIAFGYLIYFAATNYEKYSNIETGKQFLLPIMLTISFIPILAILNLVVQYEYYSLFLKRRTISNKQYYYILFSSLLYFNFNISGLIRWLHSSTISDMTNRKDIIPSMKRIILEQKQEKISPSYPELEGWLPDNVKTLLIDWGIEISAYHSDLGKLWEGSSKIKLDEDFMTGDCIYSIHGTKYSVQKLTLHLQAFDSSRTEDLNKFTNIVDTLYKNSLYREIPHKIKTSILALKKLEYKDELGDVSIRISKWKNENKGYDLYLDIRHCGFVKIDEPLSEQTQVLKKS